MTSAERVCWLATTRPDGRPHLVPIWFIQDDERIWIATGAESAKVVNIASQPRVMVGVAGSGSGDDPGDIVFAGIAELVDEAPPSVLSQFESTYGWRPGREPDPDIGSVIFIVVTPTRRVMGPSSDVG